MIGNEMQVEFNFANKFDESVLRLESVFCKSHWSGNSFDAYDKRTILLLKFVVHKKILVFERQFNFEIDRSDETVKQRACQFSRIMRKRSIGATAIQMAMLFPSEEFNDKHLNSTVCFPEMKTYMKIDGFEPNKFFEVFTKDDCEQIINFPAHMLKNGNSAYYAFRLAADKSEL